MTLLKTHKKIKITTRNGEVKSVGMTVAAGKFDKIKLDNIPPFI